MRRRTSGPTLAVAMAVAASAAGAAPASAAPPTWHPTGFAGWEAVGAGFPSRPTAIAASGDRAAVLRGGTLTVAGPDGPSVLAVPTTITDLGYVGGRLLGAAGCSVRRTDDEARTWTAVELPGCRPATKIPVATTLEAVDARLAVAARGERRWRTTDAGATWSVAPDVVEPRGSYGGSLVILTADLAFRVVTIDGPPSANDRDVLERTVDGGASWQRVALPDVLGTTGRRTALRDLRGDVVLARRSDGALVVGAGRTVLVTADGGTTFTARDLPPDALPPGVVWPTPTEALVGPLQAISHLACDAGGGCAVGAGFYGFRTAPDAPDGPFLAGAESPPGSGTSPGPGAIAGLVHAGGDDYKSGPSYDRPVRSDDLGATPYRPAQDWYGGGVVLYARGLATVGLPGETRFSLDAAGTFPIPGVPGGPSLLQTVRTTDGVAGITAAGVLWRFAHGAWSTPPVGDVRDARPVAGGRGSVLLVQPDRIRRVSDAGAVEELRHPAPAGSGWLAVAGRGGTVLVQRTREIGRRTERVAFRSTDDGDHWSRVRGGRDVPDVTAVRFVTSRLAFGLVGNRVVRTLDAGRSFRRMGTVPVIDTDSHDDEDEPFVGTLGVAFADARHGVATTTGGLLGTDDGGRSFRPLPTPWGTSPTTAELTADRLTLEPGTVDGVWRSRRASWRPALTLTLAVRRRTASTSRRIWRVAGRARGADPRGRVVVTASLRSGRTAPLRRLRLGRDGSFAGDVRLPMGATGVRAWYLGAVAPTGTTPGAAGRLVRLP